MPIKKC